MNTRDRDESANKDRYKGDGNKWNLQDESGIIYQSFFVKDYDAPNDGDYEPDSDDINDQMWDEDDEEDEDEDEEDEDDS